VAVKILTQELVAAARVTQVTMKKSLNSILQRQWSWIWESILRTRKYLMRNWQRVSLWEVLTRKIAKILPN
jgi:hypothetical protein